MKSPPNGGRTAQQTARRMARGEGSKKPAGRRAFRPGGGALIASGRVESGTLIQAKGLPYRLDELLHGDPLAAHFAAGSYLTLYLSPRD